MIDKLGILIKSIQFEKAQEVADKVSLEELEDFLLALAYETESIAIYAFVNSMLLKMENAKLHYMASVLLSQPLCHIEGAYQAAFFHAKKASELLPTDIDMKEYLLFFNEIPDKLLGDNEALVLAEEIAQIKSESEAAKKVMSKHN